MRTAVQLSVQLSNFVVKLYLSKGITKGKQTILSSEEEH